MSGVATPHAGGAPRGDGVPEPGKTGGIPRAAAPPAPALPPPLLVPGALVEGTAALDALEHRSRVALRLGVAVLGGRDRTLAVAGHRRPPTADDTNAPSPASANTAAAAPARRHIDFASRVGTCGSGGSP